ncbi:carbohydrate sulfotransferase 13-like [Mercenaria mercenaria]|uniref:carbohydrate sulfotransferase 13-like n=1 Tax=Mercenaria mercenaria TaxID=6596 RepID=UPI00234EC028|nr:carbohydrate sulfotransferase 13-like [Mercenaria mercenaria]
MNLLIITMRRFLRCTKRSSLQKLLILTGVALILLTFINVRTTEELLRQSCNPYYGDRSQDKKLTRKQNTGSDKHSSVVDRFIQRKQHLKDKCSIISLDTVASEVAVKQHLIIDDKYKLVYCTIEKNGCTFWKRVFQILNGFKNVTDPLQTRGVAAYEGYKTAEKMPFYELSNILSYSIKFIFVREPYERLLSGYVDKLFLPCAPYWFELGRFIVKSFRQNGGSSASSCGDDVTFEEFVRYYLYSYKTNTKRDVHFSHNYEHCRPCEIDYDYIAKLENFKEDTLFILKEMGLNNTVQIKNFEKETERDAIMDEIDWGFYVYESADKCITKYKTLLRIYKKLQIRGIISKDVPFPFSNKSVETVHIDEYKEALLNAHAQSGTREKRKLNRKEAFLEAYSTLPHELRTELQKELSADAELFGYATYPETLKVAESYVPKFRYFDISECS